LMFIGICTFLLPTVIYFCFKNKNWEFAQKYKYTKEPHRNSNILFKFCSIIGSASKNRIFHSESRVLESRKPEEEGFIRFSSSKNGQLRRATYRIIQIAVLYIPLVFFWAIMEQIGSLWTFQAKELNLWTGNLYTQADQVEVLNNVFVVFLIPIWTLMILPVIKASPIYKKPETKKNMPLHMMATGLLLTALSQFVAWKLQLELNSELTFSEANQARQPAKIYFDESIISHPKMISSCDQNLKIDEFVSNQSRVFDASCYDIHFGDEKFSISNQNSDDPLVVWFRNDSSVVKMVSIAGDLTNQQEEGAVKVCDSSIFDKSGVQSCNLVKKHDFERDYDATYVNGAIFIKDSSTDKYVQVTNGRTISIFKIVLQYFLLTFGEVLLSTTALEFSYTQAPSNVKAISTALWYSTTAFANVVCIALKSMETWTRDTQLLASAGMVVLAMVGFILISLKFKVYSTHDIERLDRDDDKEFLAGSSEDVDNSRTPMINTNA